jgi:rod shape-determining protein MreC
MWLPRLSKKSVQTLLFSLTLLCLYAFPKKVTDEVRYFFIERVMSSQMEAPAVVYHEPHAWSSAFWINVGADQGALINSAVLYEGSLIGLIDRVEAKKSRVLLLTDETLTVSVRVLRGEDQKRVLVEKLETLINAFRSMGENPEALEKEYDQLLSRTGKHYLAKGELQGTRAPFWRGRSTSLRGVGFNYDFSDEQGPARNLITGIAYDSSEKTGIPLIEEGDLLVTTGFDGVFPPEIPVAIVSRVFPLQEGAPSYEIEALLIAGNLQEIEKVTLLPPRIE